MRTTSLTHKDFPVGARLGESASLVIRQGGGCDPEALLHDLIWIFEKHGMKVPRADENFARLLIEQELTGIFALARRA